MKSLFSNSLFCIFVSAHERMQQTFKSTVCKLSFRKQNIKFELKFCIHLPMQTQPSCELPWCNDIVAQSKSCFLREVSESFILFIWERSTLIKRNMNFLFDENFQHADLGSKLFIVNCTENNK
mgnify:CR=1 FL=1